MAGKNRGKAFEQVVRDAFLKVPNVSIDRIPDQMGKYKGASNICDFIVYKEPYEYYIECKSVHGSTLPFSNIRENQWEGLLEKSRIEGVFAGILCWFIDKDVTLFIPIQILDGLRSTGEYKSYRFDWFHWNGLQKTVEVKGKKKRVFFEYDMEEFLTVLTKERKGV